MNEKIFKTIRGTGAASLAVGIVVLVTGISAGVMMIVNGTGVTVGIISIINGASLLKHKNNITF